MPKIQADIDDVQLSKFLSLVLRHKPETIGLILDPQGWAELDGLIIKGQAAGMVFSREDVLCVVETSDKKRFALSSDRQHIRAVQGHSLPVDLSLSPTQPPDVLYHGTAARFLDSILSTGLDARSRHHVHLSADTATALRVGGRHGKPAVLEVNAQGMHSEGYKFFLAENGVWLTDRVPPAFLSVVSK
jgi:putative RNA 2'-phosphotransferase